MHISLVTVLFSGILFLFLEIQGFSPKSLGLKPILRTNKLKLNATPEFYSFSLAEGLDAETLGALGDVADLNEVRSIVFEFGRDSNFLLMSERL